MFKIRSDPTRNCLIRIRSDPSFDKDSNPIRSEELFNKINFSFKLKYLTK
jgi:hypothetical protein